jgi:hypothetical protein
LYQAADLLGGLQLRGLRRQLVDTKIMTNKQFHDEIMRQGNMPIALIRLAVSREKLTPDMDISWKFYGELPDRQAAITDRRDRPGRAAPWSWRCGAGRLRAIG